MIANTQLNYHCIHIALHNEVLARSGVKVVICMQTLIISTSFVHGPSKLLVH